MLNPREFVGKLFSVVILSEAKNLLVLQISALQILRPLRLLRMTITWKFFNKLSKQISHQPRRGVRVWPTAQAMGSQRGSKQAP